MVLNPDFKEFIQSLNDNNVRYLVIGGYAVAFHGHPRYTKDIDVWVWLSEANATNLVYAIEQFGFASLQLTEADFLEPDTVIQLGFPPNRIDLIVGLEGMDFQTCYDARIEEMIDGIRVNFIDLAGLIRAKRIAGRHQDLADIENLEG